MESKILNDVQIINLADDIKHIEEVSFWVWEEWSRNSGSTLDDVIYRTKHSICKDRVPQTYIAKLNDELIGTVSLWYNDLITRQDLTPWLASLYIKKEYRGMGIGTLLQNKIIEVAGDLRYENLYLITDLENYYERSGWEFIENAPIRGRTTKLYVYKLT